MGIYTYKVDNNTFFELLIHTLKNGKNNYEEKILKLINGGYCHVVPNYPEVPIRSNSLMFTTILITKYQEEMEIYNRYKTNSLVIGATICFYISDSEFKITPFLEKKLKILCNKLINANSGLKINHIVFEPIIKPKNFNSLNIDESTNDLSNKIIKEILPPDIKEKGNEMAEIYLYLYCVENSLRLFIEKIAKENHGNSYFESLNTNSKIKEAIKYRKKEEVKKKWLGFRGDSEVFYLDFKDLAVLIRENWNLFKDYFPDQGFILPKIEEMADQRNIIAHNGYVFKNKRNLIKVYYENILDQIDGTFEE